MTTNTIATSAASSEANASGFSVLPSAQNEIEVALLTGGIDKPYAFGLATALTARGMRVDFIGSDEIDSPELHTRPNLRFLNFRGSQQEASFFSKACRILLYYGRLIRYAAVAKPKIFHILWNNKFQTLDRTVLMLYYKLQGRKIVFTAHNVNAAKRDMNDTFLNRITLRIQYRLCDHILVHTEMMKRELTQDFGVRDAAVSVIPFGINNAVPHTDELTPRLAKLRLGIAEGDKTILFFGRIGPYKGLEFLVAAFQRLVAEDEGFRLIIAGKPKAGCEKYLEEIRLMIDRDIKPGLVIQKINFIPDEETEIYFKAADVLVIPYTEVFQSGVIFLGYSFGLPVVASDVGSLRDEVIEGKTGFLCKPNDPADLACALERYFNSELSKSLPTHRQQIKDVANARHSWVAVARMTEEIYTALLDRTSA